MTTRTCVLCLKQCYSGIYPMIVIISAMCTLKTEALENGADMFIEKPLTEASVQEALGLRSEI